MKPTRTRRPKQNPTRQQAGGAAGTKKKNPATPDLPPNEKLNKYADEVYGDTEIPSRG